MLPEEDATPDLAADKSKTQIKRELHALRELGQQLTVLAARQLQKIPLSETLREAVLHAQTLTRGARARQLRYIGGLMPDEDVEAIRNKLQELQQPSTLQVRAFHQLEQYRDRLLEGDEALLAELGSRSPGGDHQYLRQLVRNARKEREQQKPPKSARLLFQYLVQLQAQTGVAD